MSFGEPIYAANDTRGIVTQSSPWYDDGNVILQAANVQFKVHQSILGQNSAVFRHMLSLAVPEEMGDAGCPVIGLSDSASDVNHLLNAVYDRRYVQFTSHCICCS